MNWAWAAGWGGPGFWSLCSRGIIVSSGSSWQTPDPQWAGGFVLQTESRRGVAYLNNKTFRGPEACSFIPSPAESFLRKRPGSSRGPGLWPVLRKQRQS